MLRRLGLLLGAFMVLAPAARAQWSESMEFEGRTRWWIVHEPSGTWSGPRPLVLILHGGGGSPANAARMSDMSGLSDREGFIVLYPAGAGLLSRRLLTWNAGNCCGYAMRRQVDDAGFLSALIERYVAGGQADPRRVYVAGLSNGAMMALRLACERPELVAAVASVAGTVAVPSCAPARPVSVLMIHGRADTHVLYDGGRGPSQLARRSDRSVKESLGLWLKADACPEPPATREEKGLRDEDWEHCRGQTAVRLITHQGGHVWPGGHPGLRWGNVDPIVPEPKATSVIWDFFKSHPR